MGSTSIPQRRDVSIADRTVLAYGQLSARVLGPQVLAPRGLGALLALTIVLAALALVVGYYLWTRDFGLLGRHLFVDLLRPRTMLVLMAAYLFNVASIAATQWLLARFLNSSSALRWVYLLLDLLVALLLALVCWAFLLALERPGLAVLKLDPLRVDWKMVGIVLGSYLSHLQIFGIVDLGFCEWLERLTGGWLWAFDITFGEAAEFLIANTVWLPTLVYGGIAAGFAVKSGGRSLLGRSG